MIVSLLLTACTVGPNYAKPDVKSPEAWQVDVGTANDLSNTAWWNQFGDTILNDLVQSAVNENLNLKTAAARVDQYLGVLDATRSQYFPQIGASATATTQRIAGRNTEAYQAALNASWELDFWGRVRRSTEAAQAQILSSEAGRRGVLLTLVSGVASGYITLRGMDKQLEIARETERAYAESLNIFKLRFKYGTISQLQLSQAESQYESARQAVPHYESLIRQQENLISLLLGKAPGAIPRGKIFDQLSAPGIPAGLPSSLLERRPDIIQAEQSLVAANAQIGVAKAAYFPTISLTGMLGVASNDLGKLFSSNSDLMSLGGSAVAPLFTFGAISGQVKQAEALQQQALLQYRQTVLGALREVEDALIQTTKGREQVASQKIQVTALGDYSRLSRLQFEAGTASYLQVLDADRSLFSGQLALVQGEIDVLTSLISIYKAMGGGWIDKAERLK
jgi:multidrug efflux system outer membrane protein